MEPQETKKFAFSALTMVMLTFVGLQIHAADYQTFYLDDLNVEDKVVYCIGIDSIEFVPPAAAVEYYWFTNGHQDTFRIKNLILPNGFEGDLYFQGSGLSYSLVVSRFTVYGAPDRAIICGGSAQLNVSTNYVGPESLTYAWLPTEGLDNSTIPNPKATVTSNTAYTVTVSHPNGCQSGDEINVIVNPFIASAGKDKNIICGGTAQMDAVTSNYTGSGTLTYAWSPTTGLDNPGNSDPKATVTDNTAYTVTVSTPNGCQSVDMVNVIVNPFIANAGEDKDIICGGTAQMDAVTSNYTGSGTLTYAWSPATGLDNPGISDPKATVTDNTAYTVTVSTPNGCQSEDVVNVIVNPFIASTGEDKDIICGGTAQMDAVTSNYTGSGTLTYAWSPATGLDNPGILNPKATVTGNTAYTVTVSTPNGCQSEDVVMVSVIPMNHPNICVVGVDNSNKNMIVWEKPVSASIDSFYIYKETNITNNYQKIGAISYDDISVYIDQSSNPHIQSNKYGISVKDACGLESELSPVHKTMHLSINQGQNKTWNLIWESYQGFSVSTYNIYRGNHSTELQLIGTSPASNTQYSDFSAPAGHVYYQIEIISPYNCNPEQKSTHFLKSTDYNSSRSNIATNNPLGINESPMDSEGMAIYPNPAKDRIDIEFKQNGNIGGTIEIMNLNGQTVKKVGIYSDKTRINIESLNSGIYILHLATEKGITVQKFIKE